MELESLFTGTKWEIMKAIAVQKLSPLELSGRLHTTIANISQQLRLLEMAGLVKTERTSSSEKGKPRVLYSIARDSAHLIVLTGGFAGKGLVPLTSHMAAVSRIWLLQDTTIHSGAEQALHLVEPAMDAISVIAIDTALREFVVVVNRREDKKRIELLASPRLALKIRVQAVDELKARPLAGLEIILMKNA